MKRLMSLAVAAVVATTLSACGAVPGSLVARVPTSGPIEQGERVTTQGGDQFIRVIARGPQPGMSPTEIVRGFLDASASFEGDHAVARQYLTKEADASWQPSTRVAVYEGIASLSEGGSSVSLSATKAGDISDIGQYSVSSAGSKLAVDYVLTQLQGEWRISSLPRGLVLSRADVDRSFRSQSVYFFDPTFTTLVPDARMVPVVGPAQATALMRYLLEGPSPWLAPAVTSAFRDGVDLIVDSVPVDGGVASVDLTSAALLTSDRVRQAMSEQIVWTLRQVGDITAVSITSAGQPLRVPGSPNPQSVDAWPKADPNALPLGTTGYLLDNGAVRTLTEDGNPRPAPGPAGQGQVAFTDIAVSLDAEHIAGVDEVGSLWRGPLGGDDPLVQAEGTLGLTQPVFDLSGDVWAINGRNGLVSIDERDSVTPISVSGLPVGALVRQAVPSRDGTRVALVVQVRGVSSLLLGRIVRSSDGREVRVEAPIRIENSLASVSDVAWASADSLVVLGSLDAEFVSVFTVDIARGLTRTTGSPETPTAIAGAPGLPILAQSQDGRIFRLRIGLWQSVGPGTAPTYPN